MEKFLKVVKVPYQEFNVFRYHLIFCPWIFPSHKKICRTHSFKPSALMCIMQTSSTFTWSAAELSPIAIIVESSLVGFSTNNAVTTLFESLSYQNIHILARSTCRRLSRKLVNFGQFLFAFISFLALFAFKCTTGFLLFVHTFRLNKTILDCAPVGRTYCSLSALKGQINIMIRSQVSLSYLTVETLNDLLPADLN